MSSALAHDILDLTVEHLFLVSLSMAIAAALMQRVVDPGAELVARSVQAGDFRAAPAK